MLQHRWEQQRQFNLALLETLKNLEKHLQSLSKDLQTQHQDMVNIQNHFQKAFEELQKELLYLRDETLPNLANREEEVWQAIDRKAEWALGLIHHLKMMLKAPPRVDESILEEGKEAFFCERFRGSSGGIKENLKPYLQEISQGPVVDLGCGRGEWLQLLREKKIEAMGVDTNGLFIAEIQEKGLRGEKEDSLTWLTKQKPETFGAVTAFHFLEHLPPGYGIRLMEAIHRILKDGGVFLGELPNVVSLMGFFNTFKDPDHKTFWHPETLQYYLEEAGFNSIYITGVHPFPPPPWGKEALSEPLNQLMGLLEHLIYGHQDLFFRAIKG